jgi:hypothetical protein
MHIWGGGVLAHLTRAATTKGGTCKKSEAISNIAKKAIH